MNWNPFSEIFHAAWLDERTILAAGTWNYNTPCVAVLDLNTSRLSIVHRETLGPEKTFGETDVDSAACSPSGLVAFTIGYGRRVVLYQLLPSRDAVVLEGIFPAHYSENELHVALAEDGQDILCWTRGSAGGWAGLFSRQGAVLDSIKFNIAYEPRGVSYNNHVACFRTRGLSDLQVYLVDGRFRPWCSAPVGNGGGGCDVATTDGKTLVAIEVKNQTQVFELVDIDLVQLAADAPERRREAAEALGRRRFQPAVPVLARLLADDEPSVQEFVLEALVQIGDGAALRHLIRAIGGQPDQQLRSRLMGAIRRFSTGDLLSAVEDCAMRAGAVWRRGAVRVLEAIPSLEGLGILCEAIHDSDRQVRLVAARALQLRADFRASVALLAHLTDDDEEVRVAVTQAVSATLRSAGLLSTQMRRRLEEQSALDVPGFAAEVVEHALIGGFQEWSTSPAGAFLAGLAQGFIRSGQPLSQLLNSIETLSTGRASLEVSAGVALAVALVCADALRSADRWRDAATLYRKAVGLAQQVEAPQVEWRAWEAAGECLETLGDDPGALAAFRAAMDVIHRLWFALLEEHKLRGFFRDKALLYDRAVLCCLRLGHAALALECGERAKTRYLGDLIARRQLDPRVVLDSGLREFWEDLGKSRAMRVLLGRAPGSGQGQRVEIVAAQRSMNVEGTPSIKPERLALLESAAERRPQLQPYLTMVQHVWRLAGYLSSEDDERAHERTEAVYQALLPVHQALRSDALPIPAIDRASIFGQFVRAAAALREAGRTRVDVPFWAFAEYGSGWVEEVATAAAGADAGLVLVGQLSLV